MRAQIQLLSMEERTQIHERSLKLLSETGVRIMSERGRKILGNAGAEVNKDTQMVRIPLALVEESLKLAPRKFKLGGRRKDWDLEMNIGECSLLADGGAISVLDWETGEIRSGTFDDWLRRHSLGGCPGRNRYLLEHGGRRFFH